MLSKLFHWLGQRLVQYLNEPILGYHSFSTTTAADLRNCIQPGDVLLVDGNLRISLAIKYLTQSTWSHAAIYVGPEAGLTDEYGNPAELIEADAGNGVIAVSLNKYDGFNTRLCRPVKLTKADRQTLINALIASIGRQYDIKNFIDLIRFTFPQPPVPQKWRRRMLALGSGEPTRAICSTLIAEAFEQIRYPILPTVTRENAKEIFHIRHHSLYTPRDFDISPYFEIVKPTLAKDFNYRNIEWSKHNQATDF
jgi:hypothetical protein